MRLGPCLAMCLKFFRFEAGRAYELCAYKKKNVYLKPYSGSSHVFSVNQAAARPDPYF